MSTESHLSTQRVEYEEYENDENVTVIYEVAVDGRELFSKWPDSELATYNFEPSPFERMKAQELLTMVAGIPSSEGFD
jgi:hypothetical protein